MPLLLFPWSGYLPVGSVLVTPSATALAARRTDNWSFTVSHLPAMALRAPGVQVVTPTGAALAPLQPDKSFTVGHFPAFVNVGPRTAPGSQVIVPTAAALTPRSTDNWSFRNPSIAQVGLTVESYGTAIYGVAVYGGQSIVSVLPQGVIAITAGLQALPASANTTLVEGRNPAFVTLAPPVGGQLLTPAAISPHKNDNWSVATAAITATVITLPAGEQSFILPGLNLHLGDNWSFSQPVASRLLIVQGVPPGQSSFTMPPPSPHLKDDWTILQSGPPLPNAPAMPPGQQLVAPAAMPPHTWDNWTVAPSLPGVQLTPLVAPPGGQLVIIVPPVAPPPTWARSFNQATTDWPKGMPAFDPPARAIIPNWSFANWSNPAYSAPPSLPPGMPYLAPAAVPPHQGDNWASIQRTPLELLTRPFPPMPPGGQLGPDTLVWHVQPNWSFTSNPYQVTEEDEPFPASPLGPGIEPTSSALALRTRPSVSALSLHTRTVPSALTEFEDEPS